MEIRNKPLFAYRDPDDDDWEPEPEDDEEPEDDDAEDEEITEVRVGPPAGGRVGTRSR